MSIVGFRTVESLPTSHLPQNFQVAESDLKRIFWSATTSMQRSVNQGNTIDVLDLQTEENVGRTIRGVQNICTVCRQTGFQLEHIMLDWLLLYFVAECGQMKLAIITITNDGGTVVGQPLFRQ